MDFWYILGIEPTRDVDEIKMAYKKQLKLNHPEDNPEGFKALRAAMEKALEYAASDGEQKSEKYDDTPVGRWMQKVDDLYNDYWARIDEKSWDELFAEDVFFCIDTAEEIRERLMVFLMQHHFFPQKIWKRLAAALELEENYEDYNEKFPHDFLDYFNSHVKYSDSFNYELFEPHEAGLPYDDYIVAYYNMRNAISEQKAAEAESIKNTLENMPVYHPFFSISRINLLFMNDKPEEARRLSDELFEKYPEEPECMISRASVLYHSGDYEEALKLYEKCEGIENTAFTAKCGKADCLLELKRHKEAQKLYKDLLMERHFDGYIHYKLTVCNESLITLYRDNIEKNSRDYDSQIELSWCYYQNNQIQEAYDVIKNSDATGSIEMDFCYLKARCLFGLDKEKKADSLFVRWCELFEQYRKCEGEIIKRNTDREELVYYFRAEIAMRSHEYEAALGLNEKARALMKLDKDLIIAQRGMILSKLGKDAEAIEELQKALDLNYDNVQAMIILGDCYKNVGRLQDAYSIYERAIYTVPFLSEGYVKLARMLIEGGQNEQATEMVRDFRQRGYESDAVDFCMALIERERDDFKKSAEILKSLDDRIRSGQESDLFYIIEKDEYSYIRADVLAETGDIDEQEAIDILKGLVRKDKTEIRYVYSLAALCYRSGNYAEAIKNYKKALKLRPNNETIMIAIANSYREMKDDKELKSLMDILRLNPQHPYAHGQIGEYYENRGKCESALIYYSKQLETDPSDYFYISRGIMYLELCKADKAIQDFKEAADFNSTNPYAYYNIGRTLLRLGQADKAEKYLEKAIEVCGEDKRQIFFNQLARCYCRQRGNIEEAAEKIRRLFDGMSTVFPNDPGVMLNRGKALRALGYAEEAIECFERGIIIDKDNRYRFGAQIINTVMDVFMDEERALEYIKRFRKKEGTENILDALYYFELFFGKVENEYKWSVKQPGENELILYNRAIAAKKYAGEKKSATGKRQLMEEYDQCLDKAEEIAFANTRYGTDRLQGYRRLAMIAIKRGNIDKAKEYLEKAEKAPICDYCVCSACYELLMVRSEIAIIEKDRKKALEYAEKALEICPDDGEIKLLIKEIKEM